MVSCPIFDVPHAKETCRGPPDYLSLGNQRWVADFTFKGGQKSDCLLTCVPILIRKYLSLLSYDKMFLKGNQCLACRRFCQKSGPVNFTSTLSKLALSFVSNKNFEGEGAECTIACSDVSQTNEGTCFDCEGIIRELQQIKQICQGPTPPYAGLPSYHVVGGCCKSFWML